MSDQQTPPDWVLIEAARRCELSYHIDFLREFYNGSLTFRALCDMIQKYEQPPVDRKVLCARAAAQSSSAQDYVEKFCIRAIELFEEGFGRD